MFNLNDVQYQIHERQQDLLRAAKRHELAKQARSQDWRTRKDSRLKLLARVLSLFL